MEEHKHQYDEKGRQLCCTQEAKIYTRAEKGQHKKESHHQHHNHDHGDHDHEHDHEGEGGSVWKMFLPSVVSLGLLLINIVFDHFFETTWFNGGLRVACYLLAYAPVGIPVIKEAIESFVKREFFSEFFLMVLATAGAFAIGEYPEGVAVMLFYAIGEVFQTLAVKRAKAGIKELLDQRPDTVTVLQNNEPIITKAETVKTGEIIQLKPGEKLALDGELLSETASFNTSALTGESKPDTKRAGETVLAGMINLNTVCQIKVTAAYADSKLSKILELVQDATTKKAPAELFIRKFARIYTPIVVLLAVALCFVPWFFVNNYQFNEWLYRALVFMVISCPCALVISIPLGYFGGIGAASRKGILFKGSNFLDTLATVRNVVMDKTGTLTEGVFKVKEVVFDGPTSKEKMLQMVNALEAYSSHPVASAIHNFAGGKPENRAIEKVEEIAGLGLRALVEGKELLVGNFKLLDNYNISYPTQPNEITDTLIAAAYNQKFEGYLTISDVIKPTSKVAVERLNALNVKVTMLSGDKSTVVKKVAEDLGINNAFGDLLPEDKVNKVNEIKFKKESVAFVGDGVNDAPVVALSDVGIAMGGLGSDATIETADIVIQDDNPANIPLAIEIGKATKRVVWQNISLAFAVKIFVLILGAGGLATMWEAVFADVGVALLAILNAVRIQSMKF